MASAKHWGRALWNHYRTEIRPFSPFYLVADEELIKEIATTQHLPLDQDFPERDFEAAARSLVDVSTFRATLKPDALEPCLEGNRSLAIVLAVQQVVVVEHMLRDKEVSEQAYFPRYRQALGMEYFQRSSNPILAREFELIWKTLERELKALPNATTTTLTFAPGLGRDRARNYPLSQALLTTHDLNTLREELVETDLTVRDQVLQQRLFQLKGQISSRGQRLLESMSDPTLGRRLCHQVRAYLRAPKRTSLFVERPLTKEEAAGFYIAAQVEGDGLFDEIMAVFFEQKNGNHISATEPESVGIMRRRVSTQGRIWLIPNMDRFTEATEEEALNVKGTRLVVIWEGALEDERKYLGEKSSNGSEIEFEPTRSNLPDGFQLLSISGDFTGDEKEIAPDIGRLASYGGLIPDARRNSYLCGYPPTAILYDGKPLSPDTIVEVDNDSKFVADLFRLLQGQREFFTCRVSYEGQGLLITMEAQREAEDITTSYAFPLVGHSLGPCIRELREDEGGIDGHTLRDRARVPFPGVRSGPRHLHVSHFFNPNVRQIHVPSGSIDTVQDLVRKQCFPPNAERFLLHVIAIRRTLPLSPFSIRYLRFGED